MYLKPLILFAFIFLVTFNLYAHDQNRCHEDVENNLKISPVAYKRNYILPLVYDTKDYDYELGERQQLELKFQLSLKQHLTTKDCEQARKSKHKFYFGYTQKSFWQVYDHERSEPFREHNYNPEFFWNYRCTIDDPFCNQGEVNIGLEHESNGAMEPISRTWYKLYVLYSNDPLSSKKFGYNLKVWYIYCETCDFIVEQNPHLSDFYGSFELTLKYQQDPDQPFFSSMIRNNLKSGDDNKGALRIDVILPIKFFKVDIRGINFQYQYWTGYGESLIDYDVLLTKHGLGVVLSY